MNTHELKEIIIQIFKQGVHGDAVALQGWLKMLKNLASNPIPDNLTEYKEIFEKVFINSLAKNVDKIKKPKVADLKTLLDQLVSENLLEVIEPYQEYRLKNSDEYIFANKDSDFFFACNSLDNEPLQFIRSRVQNFCLSQHLNPENIDDLVIAITEAAENAIKYSDKNPIVIHQFIKDQEYTMQVVNSCHENDVNAEIEKGKFSEQVSLMRGVLVMSKLLDNLDLDRDLELNLVKFVGTRKVSTIALSNQAAGS